MWAYEVHVVTTRGAYDDEGETTSVDRGAGLDEGGEGFEDGLDGFEVVASVGGEEIFTRC